MLQEIIINSSSNQNRVAILEDGKLVDFLVEHSEKRRMVGDIYYGRIARVLPGIRAAFVDIGMKHDAFLHFSDIGDRLSELQGMFDDDADEQEIEKPDDKAAQQEKIAYENRQASKLKKGQDILIQIIKEPVKDKGVRVTSSISIPGRFCVLLPFDNKIGISKKINDYKERRRLKRIARGIIPQDFGLIIRTAARNQSEELLSEDLKYILKIWEELQENVKSLKPPVAVYEDISTTLSVIRDLLSTNVSKIYIDSRKLMKEIRHYIQAFQPKLSEKIIHYRGNEPIFEAFKIEEQIKELMGRRVPLPSGGHIVIEHTEAMTVVDVNSGRYAAKKEQELNSLKTDLEASREIVRQLRLRDIGGLIVIDFIDLEDDRNRKKVYDELRKEFKKDRAKVAMLPMTDFGLMQITRQRVRENIIQSTHDVCPYCNGTGLLVKKSNLIHEIEEWIKKFSTQGKGRSVKLKVHPSLGIELRTGFWSVIRKLQLKYFIKIKLEESDRMDPAVYNFVSLKTGEDITAEIS